MAVLERIFRRSPLTFLVITFLAAGLFASAFQEIGNAVTNLIIQLPLLNTWGAVLLVWVTVLVVLFLLLSWVERTLVEKWRYVRFEWSPILNHSKTMARIRITNGDDFKFDECLGELVKLYREDAPEQPIGFGFKYFAWSNEAYRDSSQQITSIPRGHDAILDIAKIEGSYLVFTFAYHTGTLTDPGVYRLSINFQGSKNGFDFGEEKRFTREFILKYDGQVIQEFIN